jgi:hypothetical protein
MAKKPKAVEIRSYQVGFGDCFLLSFVYGDNDKRHVLIDFGTMELARASGTASQHMPKVAASIREVCKGQLTAVVATHRHADHISGFGTDGGTGKSGEIIKSLRPKVVLQPWTEDPKAAKDAKKATRDSSRSRKSFVASLGAMHGIANMVYDLTRRPPRWMGPELRKELSFIGQDNIRNESAVRNLIAMSQVKGASAVWAHHGSSTGLERHLPGVKIHVLGPPNLGQTERIRSMRRTDPDQFWHLLGGPRALRAVASPKRNRRRKRAASASRVPAEARWFRDRLERLQGEQLLQIVRILDDQMNNTSLILLFEVFGKKLLFPGDAQIENWSYALQDAPDAKKTREALRGVDLYKVGHHGSLNATPKTLLWGEFQKRKKPGDARLKTLLSTLPGKHGKTRSKTEVPRRTLLAVLKEESSLQNTDDLPVGKKGVICHTVVIKP